MARLDDGHGGVYHASQQKLGRPPFAVEWVEDQAVVLASRDGSFKRGDVVLAIDGRAVRDILREDEEYLSGSPQWKRFRSTNFVCHMRGHSRPRTIAALLRSW